MTKLIGASCDFKSAPKTNQSDLHVTTQRIYFDVFKNSTSFPS